MLRFLKFKIIPAGILLTGPGGLYQGELVEVILMPTAGLIRMSSAMCSMVRGVN